MSDTNIRKVISLLRGDKPISKKEACSTLNIAYNTTRLQNIIDDFEETQAYREKRKSQNKGKAATQDEMADAIESYLSGSPISEIAAGLYRSSGFVKAIIERVGVPQKGEGVYDILPEQCVAESFEEGEVIWSAKYHSPAIIKKECVSIDYEEKYESKCYNIWIIEKISDDYSERWSTSLGAGFTASQLAYDLGKLTHLQEYGVNLSRI